MTTMNPERWKQVKLLCQSALGIERGKRETYLEEACAGDESLCKEVAELLAHQTEAEGFLKDPAIGVAAWELARDPSAHSRADLTGQRVAHYRIVGKIGEGGMGVVYRARDTRLARDVAVKVLPGSLSGDRERVVRFEREARLLATLNHPNIASVFGLEEADGKRFLVLELVEGQTLAERLHKGPLPVEEAVEVCRQIAEGLEAAHEKGIIHRDLKPANVMVTPDGKVKVLDFGLARALHDQAATADSSHSPAIRDEMTRPGLVLGTAAYMSPEQAKGKAVDKRVDIWGFGCVMFECLTGRRAFQGDTITETMAAILKSEPDWTLLPVETPAVVRPLLRRCLQKEPGRRLHDIADARVEIMEELSQPAEAIPVTRRLTLGWVLSIAITTLVIGVLIGLGVMTHLRRLPSLPVVRSIIRIEPGQWLAGMGRQVEFWRPSRTAMAVSSDGRYIIYSAIEGNPSPHTIPRLYIRHTDKVEARSIAGTEGGISPFLSPDDRWVGFWAHGKLIKIAVGDGVPTVVCDAPLLYGASWGTDNNIIFSPGEDVGLFSVSANGGTPVALTAPDRVRGEHSHRLPFCLPDHNSVLFTIMNDSFDMRPHVAELDVKTKKWRTVIEDAADARYVSTGHLIFVRQGSLMALPFDRSGLETAAQPVPVASGVMQALNVQNAEYNTGAGQYGISDAGLLVYLTGGMIPDLQHSLVWVDQQGTAQPIVPFRAPFHAPRLSTDGLRIAYGITGGERRLFTYDRDRGTASQLSNEGKAVWSNWTPDGKRLIFSAPKSGVENLYWQAADGSSPMEPLTTSENYQSPGPVSPDGSTLAFVEARPDTRGDVLLLRLSDKRVTPFLNSGADERYPEFSPDGCWMAYTSDESGRDEVYVRPFPNPGGKWQISFEGGREPLWARNGRQLFYRSRDQVWAVGILTDRGFKASRPRLLFDKPEYRIGDPCRGWDISPDGRTFMMVKLDERKPQPVTELILVQNWFEELKRLVPTGK